MATILQLNDADFSGKGLPIITPLLSAGLIGAFRPAKSILNTTDLSGSGATASLYGSPVFKDNYVECDGLNGLATNLKETSVLTMCFVGRFVETPTDTGGFLGGTFNGAAGVSMSKGLSGVNAQFYLKKISDGTYVNKIFRVVEVDQADLGQWAFYAMRVDTAAGKVTSYNSVVGFAEYDAVAAGLSLSDRNGLDKNMMIGRAAYDASTYKAKVGIAEALFYNRALTNTEIIDAYNISKKAMIAKGIAI